MKTSKIIFLILIGTIAAIILAALIDLRINGRRDSDIAADFRVKKHPLNFFKVISVTNSMNVTLVKNDTSYLEVTSSKDSITPRVSFSQNEDTLKISDFEKVTHHDVSIRIHATGSLKKILLKNSDFTIEHLSFAALSLNLDQSTVWFNQNDTERSHLQFLEILAKNHSVVNADKFNADSVGITLIHSEAYLEIQAGKLFGSLSDSSRIQARQPEEIWLKKDGMSKVNINDY